MPATAIDVSLEAFDYDQTMALDPAFFDIDDELGLFGSTSDNFRTDQSIT
jgi:hypothetical protein